MRIKTVCLVVSCFCVASSFAQTGSSAGSNTQEINAQNANNVCRIYFSMPKPGMSQQYEAGRKKHMQFHRAQKDTWTWSTFAVETGDNAGMYVTSSCGHGWKDSAHGPHVVPLLIVWCSRAAPRQARHGVIIAYSEPSAPSHARTIRCGGGRDTANSTVLTPFPSSASAEKALAATPRADT